MFRTTRMSLTTAALATSVLALTAVPADAATDYSNCDQMHHTFKYGVARSKAAADKQQRTGHYRPAVKPKVYRLNTESDADKDGTACEVTR
jgi:hypothetical protein